MTSSVHQLYFDTWERLYVEGRVKPFLTRLLEILLLQESQVCAFIQSK